MLIVLSFDPGLKGGVCALGLDDTTYRIQKILHLDKMPVTADKLVDMQALRRLVTALRKFGRVFCVLERAQAMHRAAAPGMDDGRRDGSKNAFTTGRNYGRIEASIEALNIPYVEFTPRKWQNKIFEGLNPDMDTKQKSVAFVRKRYPQVNLVLPRCRNPHDGMSDALCIATYGVSRLKDGSINV